jgi:hypothetical protein
MPQKLPKAAFEGAFQMCKNLDSPHPLTPSPKDGIRGNTARLRFFDEYYKSEDAINRRLYNNHCFVLTAINRVSYPNRTVLGFS